MQFDQLKRRELITLLGGAAAAWSLVARAQQPAKVARIGILGLASEAAAAPYVNAVRAGLRDFGYIEGKNLIIEYRFGDANYERLPALAAELVHLNVDVLVTFAAPGTQAAKSATKTIPIVMAVTADAVGTGLIASLAHPGGNVTGTTVLNPELMAKRLELLKELMPTMTQAAVLLNPDNAANGPVRHAMEMTAKALNVGLHPFELRGSGEIESVFAAMVDGKIDALVVHDDQVLIGNAKAIAALAAKQNLPSCGFLEFAAVGGLSAYGVNFVELCRHAAYFVDKILKGAMPGDLPVEQPTKFELVFNLKTAKALGLEIPPMLLARADEVIE
jgi:putative tryptophan/tyrosine transport system substrate-binding protein